MHRYCRLGTVIIISSVDRIGEAIKFPLQIVPRFNRDKPFEVVSSEEAPKFKKQPEDEEDYELDGNLH
jgi:hypothetical protein